MKFLLRATRGDQAQRHASADSIARIRQCLAAVDKVTSVESLLGCEGMAAKAYFAALPTLLSANVPPELFPAGRTKHPPRDRFNALLSFGYALTQTVVHRCALAVGLEPAFGFYHQPRTAAPPLILDVMELFRTVLCEMPVIASINRMQWDIVEDFNISVGQVWLSDQGRKKLIQLFEQRLEESYKHPHTGQSLTYVRMVELELRLLEKEWSGSPGLFANFRLR